MKELQVAKVRDFKGLLPTVRYRGRRNKKGNKKNKKKKKTKREKKKENGTRGDVVEKERERDRNRHTHTHTHTEGADGDGRKLSRAAFNLPRWVTELENLRSSF